MLLCQHCKVLICKVGTECTSAFAEQQMHSFIMQRTRVLEKIAAQALLRVIQTVSSQCLFLTLSKAMERKCSWWIAKNKFENKNKIAKARTQRCLSCAP
jgi:hypothetical protein